MGGEAFEDIARAVAATLGVPVVVLTLLEPATGELVARARVGVSAIGYGSREAEAVAAVVALAGQVAARMTPVLVSGADPALRALLPDAGPMASAACFPLMDGAHLLGALLIASASARVREMASQASFQPFCQIIAMTVGATLRGDAATASAHLSARFLAVARNLTSSLDLSAVLAATVAGIRQMVACDQVVVVLCDAASPVRAAAVAGEEVESAARVSSRDLRIASQWPSSATDAESQEVGQGLDRRAWSLVEWVVARERPRALLPGEGVVASAEDGEALSKDDGEPLAYYCSPLKADALERAATWGAILVARAQPFSAGEIQVLTQVATLSSTALANSRAHQAASTRHERVRSDYLSGLSHELRQPLQTITGWLEIALDQREVADDPRETYLRRAYAASEHLAELIDDLLLLSSRDAGTPWLQPRMQDPRPLLRSAVEEMELRATQAQVRLNLEPPPDLPPVAVDGLRLSQVLRNLIGNALKFTPRGGQVTVAAAATPSEILIRVSDTGIGIAPEHQSRIFERNYQVPEGGEAGERERGHGLGLAIVRLIAEGHGGSVGVESAPGQGSTFTVHLPR